MRVRIHILEHYVAGQFGWLNQRESFTDIIRKWTMPANGTLPVSFWCVDFTFFVVYFEETPLDGT